MSFLDTLDAVVEFIKKDRKDESEKNLPVVPSREDMIQNIYSIVLGRTIV